ncbi:DUF1796 family putative cysteine peptidase [Luteolibacter sp. AS25]|uniref:DUF1796 family putative cysteine peptidase n=1 Tax=Luteolibacter sp. AS25 TaxID=3135776 RepID=UPI00398B91A4
MKPRLIIPVGSNCLPRTIPTRFGLKKTKAEGEITYPFDLAVHPYNAVCNLLENDFMDYVNPEFLRISEDNTIINIKYGIKFNHESVKDR